MSEAESSKKPRRRKKRKLLPDAVFDLPDDEAILKLFPKKVVEAMNKVVEHVPKPSKE
ncbi:MAG: hypothetical protein HQ478_09385 [Chloroflexi bacterium]|nr:hypothetical protein [Chloroflexota bacterium]